MDIDQTIAWLELAANAANDPIDKQHLQAAAQHLRRLRDAGKCKVIGWRENDWPEGFDRRTAELIAHEYSAALNEAAG